MSLKMEPGTRNSKFRIAFSFENDPSRYRPTVGQQLGLTWFERRMIVERPAATMATSHYTASEPRHVGPHPSHVKVAQPYIFEEQIRYLLAKTGVAEAKEDMMRLQGVSWIDNVRKALFLWVFIFGN